MNKIRMIVAAAALVAATAPQFAAAQDTGNFLVRVRATRLNSANDNNGDLKNTLQTLGFDHAEINDKWIPELDLSYFFTPNIAAELILTYPQKQTLYAVDASGAKTELGSFKHLPPTLLAQYHFTGIQGVRPYVGAGINYTNVTSSSLDTVPSLGLNLSRNSWGLAAQVGADFPIGGGWLINVDAKYVRIGVDVTSAGTKIGEFGVNPWLLSVGVGKRF
jgi:outer membrane protein